MKRIGPYEVLRELGRGGMGTVHAARGSDGGLVALKVLHKRDGAPRFERERRLLEKLGHEEGFVPLLGAGEDPQGPWIAMRFYGGGTLRARLKHGRLPVAKALEIARTLAAAMGRAHALGVVHRDLKPENVLFDGAEVPVITDLGLAKHFRDDVPGASQSVSISSAGSLRGTPRYMPPEQLIDAKNVGPPADVFAIGAILFECLTGETPFAADTLAALLKYVKESPPPPLRELRPDTPPWVVPIVEKALAKKAEDRFADGAALAAALTEPRSTRRGGALVAALSVALVVGAVVLRAATRPAPPPPSSPPPTTTPVVAPTPSTAKTNRILQLERTFGDRRWTVGRHTGPVSVAPRTNKAVVFGDGLKRLAIVDLDTGEVVLGARISEDDVLDLHATPDGSRFVVATGKEVLVFAAAAPLVPAAKIDAVGVVAVAITEDGSRVLTANSKGVVEHWDVAAPASPLHSVQTGGKSTARIRFTKKADGFVVGVYGGPLEVRGFGESAPRVALQLGAGTGRFALSPDGTKLAVRGAQGRLEVRDAASGAVIAELESGGKVSELDDVAFSSDGATIATLTNNAVKLWSAGSARFLRELPHTLGYLGHVAFARGDARVVVAGDSGSVRLLDATTGEDSVREARGSVEELAVNNAATRATVVHGALIERLDLSTGRSESFRPPQILGPYEVALSAQGDRMLYRGPDSKGSNGVLQVWDVANELKIRELVNSPNAKCPAISHDGRRGAAMAGGNRLRVWDLETGKLLANVIMTAEDRTEPGYTAPTWIRFDRDSRHALWFCETRLSRIEVATGTVAGSARFDETRASCEGALTPAGDAVLIAAATPPALLCDLAAMKARPIGANGPSHECAAVTPDGTRALLGDSDGSLSLHDLESGALLDRIVLEDDMPTALALSPDGRMLLVGTARGVVLRFAVKP